MTTRCLGENSKNRLTEGEDYRFLIGLQTTMATDFVALLSKPAPSLNIPEHHELPTPSIDIFHKDTRCGSPSVAKMSQ